MYYYALWYMSHYGKRLKYLDKVEIALTKCSIIHTMCNGCPALRKCVRHYSHLCEDKQFQSQLSSWRLNHPAMIPKAVPQSGELVGNIRLPIDENLGFGVE